MKWSLSQLKSYRETPLQFDEALDIKHSLMTRYPEIIDVKSVHAKGLASYSKDNVLITAKIEAMLTLPSSRSLTPVDVPLAFQMTEYHVPEGTDLSRFDEETDTVVFIPEDDILDFDVAVEDNILIHIPMQILSEAELNGGPMPTGKGWEVLTEDDLDDLRRYPDLRRDASTQNVGSELVLPIPCSCCIPESFEKRYGTGMRSVASVVGRKSVDSQARSRSLTPRGEKANET